jgi:hypothetical protein
MDRAVHPSDAFDPAVAEFSRLIRVCRTSEAGYSTVADTAMIDHTVREI